MTNSKGRLINALVGEREELYRDNQHFYASINYLADMLPYWVDGIAEASKETKKKLEEEVRRITEEPLPPFYKEAGEFLRGFTWSDEESGK